jgi:hypothetical protein
MLLIRGMKALSSGGQDPLGLASKSVEDGKESPLATVRPAHDLTQNVRARGNFFQQCFDVFEFF